RLLMAQYWTSAFYPEDSLHTLFFSRFESGKFNWALRRLREECFVVDFDPTKYQQIGSHTFAHITLGNSIHYGFNRALNYYTYFPGYQVESGRDSAYYKQQ